MKIVIDISNAMYNNIMRTWEKIHPKMWEILKNAKPYEERPQGDLISREALKKAIDTWDKFGYTTQGELIRLDEKNKDLYVPFVKYQDIVNCIDNAPTVEITEEQAIDKLHETGWMPRHDKEMTERPTAELLMGRMTNGVIIPIEKPKGEWEIVSTSEGTHFYRCSECHSAGDFSDRFCRRCGAKMKGDAK